MIRTLILILVLPFLYITCARYKTGNSSETKIISFQKEFAEFWNKSKNLPLDQQMSNWNTIIETPHQEFYDSFVWPKAKPQGFSERKRRLLENTFKKYAVNSSKIESAFMSFPHTVMDEVQKFRRIFPDAELTGPIMGVLSPTFNGKSGHIASRPHETILAFAVDLIVERNDNPITLYPHELFHIYHTEKSGIKDDGAMPGLPLTIPLWAEGLATYVSFELSPEAPMKDIYMDEALSLIDQRELPLVASRFLKIANSKISDSKNPDTFREWFMMGSSFDERFPSRCGYWLGFKVIQTLRKRYSLKEMATWKIDKAHAEVIQTLQNLSDDSMEMVHVGKFQSRGLWSPTPSGHKMPAIVLIPGSGPNGPEELVPPQITVDNKIDSIFKSVSKPFLQAKWNVLCLGKPGIEFNSGSWDLNKLFYDKDLYMHLRWEQLIENLDEAVKYLKAQPNVDPERIFILGHSQGTQVAVEYASLHPELAGLILIGYSAEDYKSILDWQMFKRPIEHFVATDVDVNHDGFVSRNEAAKWPGPFNLDDSKFDWNFRPGKNKISYAEVEADIRGNAENQKLINNLKNAQFLANGLFDRGPLYKMASALPMPLYVFTGSLDLLTPPKEALKLGATCKEAMKTNCEITIVPGLGHGFSPPRGPRMHPLLDITVGPVDEKFLNQLSALISRI